MPVPYFKSMSPLAKGTEARGLLKRIAKRVDDLTRTVATMETDWGLELSSDGIGRIKLCLAYAPKGGAGGGLANSAFVAKATPEEGLNVDTYEVRMLGGTAQGMFGGIEVINTTVFTGIYAGELFWLEFHPNRTPGSQWSVEHGSSLPASAATPSADNPNYFAVIPLFKVEAGAGGESVNILQYHYGSVYVPTVENIVQIQEPVSGGADTSDSGSGSGSGSGSE